MFFDKQTHEKPLKRRQLLNLLVAGEVELKTSLARHPRPLALLAVSPVNRRVPKSVTESEISPFASFASIK